MPSALFWNFPRPVKSSVNRKRGAVMYFHVRFQNAMKINKRPIFSQKASIVVRTQSSFDGSTLDKHIPLLLNFPRCNPLVFRNKCRISLFSQPDCDTWWPSGFGRHVMNLTFLSTIGSSNSCTFWLCRFESRSSLLT